ncbi:MAG TPA: PEGA domain-containing protein [Bryobacteraceae bacterium]|nr:PEGA domain-containing protein [Bryobacteraceae bacterium]
MQIAHPHRLGFVSLLFFLAFPVGLLPQTPPPLTNQRVMQLVQSGVNADELLRLISTAPTVSFSLNPVDTDQLLRAGVSEEAIKIMAARANGLTSPVAPTRLTDLKGISDGPSVVADSSNIRSVGDEKANDALTVTSIPPGATVEWNRKIIGTTPLTYKVGEYAFNARKSTIFSKRLLQPVVLRLSKEGYVTKEATITKPWIWRSLNGQLSGTFYTISSNSLQINLDKIAAVPVALTNSDVVKLKTAGFGDDLIIDKIATNPSAFHLEFDDMVELRKAGISDAIIQAMLHAK